jgi:hypothetical protein
MPKFSLGRLVATPGALAELKRVRVSPEQLLGRHSLLDRGALDAHDHEANSRAASEGSRIFSAFEYSGMKFWVITEWNRSQTTILLPDEY